MTLGDWDQNIATRSTEELERNQQSLIDLQRWQTFEVEFKWTSMFTLLISIEAELRQRNTDSNRIEHTFHPHIFADCPACQAAWAKVPGGNEMKTLQQAAADAVAVQDACNTSGVARAMVEAIDAIRASGAHANQHPIVYMYAYKLLALNGHEPLDQWDAYTEAERACKAIAETEVVTA